MKPKPKAAKPPPARATNPGKQVDTAEHASLFASSLDAILFCDTGGRILAANAAAYRMFGYSEAELLQLGRGGIIDAADPRVPLAQAEFERTGKFGGEVTFLRKGGTRFPGELSASAFRAKDGAQQSSVIVRDISEHKRVETLLHTRLYLSEFADTHSLDELLQKTLDEAEVLSGSQIGFAHFLAPDQKTLILQMWSSNTLKHMCKAEGKGSHYAVGRAGVWADCVATRAPLIHNDYPSLRHRKGLPAGHAPIQRELVVPVLRDGQIVMIMGVGNKPTDYDEKDVDALVQLAGLAWDIVHRKRAEEALALSEQSYRNQFANNSSVMLLIDPADGAIVEANAAALGFYGYPREQLLGRRITEINTLPEAEVRQAMASVPADRGKRFEFQHRLANGSVRDVQVSSSRIQFGVRSLLHTIVQDITDQKRAEEALRASEERFHVIACSTPDPIIVQDRELRYTFVLNPQIGLTEQDMVGKTDYDFLAKDVADRLTALKRQVLASGQPLHLEVPLLSKKGTLEYFDGTYVAKTGPEGKIDGLVGYFRNVTERRLAEETLRRSQALLARTENIAHIGSWDWEAATDTVAWSEELFRIFQRDPAQGAPSFAEHAKLYLPEDFSRLQDAMQAALAQGLPYELKLHARRNDGEVRVCLARGHAETTSRKDAPRLFGTLQDITELDRAERTLRESAEQHRTILQTAIDGFWIVDTAGRLLEVNDTYCRMSGYSLSELLGLRVSDLEASETPAVTAAHMKAVIAQGAERFESRHRRKDGSVFDVAVSVQCHSADDERLVVFLQDITLRKQAEIAQAHQEAQLRRAEMVAGIGNWELNLATREITASANARQLYGLGDGALTLADIQERPLPEFRAKLDTALRDLIESGRPYDVEFQIQRATDGRIFDIHSIAGYDMVERTVFGVLHDITSHKQAEAALRQSDTRFRTLFEQATEGILYLTPALKVMAVNEAFARMHGYTVAEMKGMHLQELDTPAARQLAPERLARLLAGESLRLTVEHCHRDGHVFPLEVSTGMIEIGGEKIIQAFNRDITARMQAEAARRESEENYRRLFEGMLDGFALHEIICDAAGRPVDYRFISVNPAFERLTGLRAADTVGRTVLEIMPQTEPQFIERYGRVALTGEGVQFEEYSSSLQRHFEIAAFQPKPGQFATVFIDITERKQAETALRASEHLHRSILNASPDDITITDLQGHIRMVSPVAMAMFGYERQEEFIGRPITDFIVPENRAQAAAKFAGLLQNINPGGSEYLGLRRDGTTFDLEVKGELMRDAAGHTTGLIFVARDITERNETAKMLAESQSLISAVVESNDDIIWTVDAQDFALMMFNKAFADYFQRERGICLKKGHRAEDLFPIADFGDRWRGYFRRALSESFTLEYQTYIGGIIFLLSFAPLKRDGHVFALSVFGKDITKRKQAENALNSSLMEKEALLKEVHHRVKNNLQVITSLLRLESGRSEQTGTKSVLVTMQGRIRSMALLHEALYRSGTFAAIDLGAYLKQIATQAFRTLGTSSVAVQLHVDVVSVQVEMDHAMPCGLLVNELVSNCLKHGFPDGRSGEVRVGLQLVGGGPALRLRVCDTGVGLPADFEARREKSLGLQLVRDLAKQVEGRLEIGPGPGTTFELSFTPKLPPPANVSKTPWGKPRATD